MSNNGVYAGRKRRKPVPKSVKSSPAEGAKSNPSKRHRDRLNGELDQLASLLPFHQDIISKFDKLTVLRLSVGYLRAKGHFNVTLKSNKSSQLANSISKSQVPEIPEGELLLQVINGFVLVVTEGGTVFYTSSSVQDHLGFHQSDIVHQSVYDFIHTEDRAEFQRQLHWALNPSISTDTRQMERDSQLQLTYYSPEQLPPENSAFLERNFICRLRCLLDNSSGFLAMNFQGRLKFLQGQNKRTKEGTLIPPQLALFALASPLQPPSILEIRAKNYIYRTKHKLDFTPLACDAKGKIVLGYTEEELCYRGSGYQFIHAADMLYCADNHIRMMKTGESGMTVFRLLTKCSGWVWVQANARLVYKNGRPDFIIASQRVLTKEEGEENLKKRSLMLPFSFTTGEAVLYDSSLPKSLSGFSDPNAQENRNIPSPSTKLDPNSLLGSMLKQDKSIYKCSASSNEPQAGFQEPEEEELGGIFSSNFQEGLLSLSESSLFKHDTVLNSRNEESGCELLSFMGSLGISPEDLELLDQEEIFLNVEFDDRAGLEDLTDEVLSYVEESLRKKTDLLYSSSFGACLEEKNLPNSAPSLFSSQCRPQEMSGPSFTSHQYLPFLDHPEPKIQPFAEVHSYIQPQPSIPTQECQPQGFIYKTEELSQQQNLPYPVNYSCVEEPNQLCHRFKNIQGANCSFISPLESGHRAQNLPIFQQPGTFFLETSPLNLPYRNQLPNNCTQDFPISYLTSGDTRVNEFSSQDLEELLNGLEGGSQPKRGLPEGVQREDGCPWKPAGEL